MELIKDNPSIENQFRMIISQFGNHTGKAKAIVEKMWNSPKIRTYFYPYLHYEMLKIHIAEIFGA